LTLSDRSYRCGFSKDWCLAAPGTGITSAWVSGSITTENHHDADGEVDGFKVTGDNPAFNYLTDSGTSIAAPHVTGGLALLMERFPYLDNPKIRDVLLTTATDLGEPGVDDVYGWGLMNLKKAIDGPGQLRVDTVVN
ncbi:S8 family serine peptidase, partial [Paenibacillus aquistagni]